MADHRPSGLGRRARRHRPRRGDPARRPGRRGVRRRRHRRRRPGPVTAATIALDDPPVRARCSGHLPLGERVRVRLVQGRPEAAAGVVRTVTADRAAVRAALARMTDMTSDLESVAARPGHVRRHPRRHGRPGTRPGVPVRPRRAARHHRFAQRRSVARPRRPRWRSMPGVTGGRGRRGQHRRVRPRPTSSSSRCRGTATPRRWRRCGSRWPASSSSTA